MTRVLWAMLMTALAVGESHAASTTIKLRHDTAAAYTAANPVLSAGERGQEDDTGREKKGDGTTAWASLAYWGLSGSGTQYYLPMWSSTGTLGALAGLGTSGYVLTSNGAGAYPTFQAAAGGGNVSSNGTPALHQFGVWYDSTHVKGIAVTGSKVVCTDSNGEPVACTNLTDTAVMTPAMGGTGVANGSSNTVTFTGNYSLGVTLLGATTVTLPTSGTLAKNDGSNLAISGQAIGDLAVASSTTAYGKVADVAVGQVLTSGGTGTAPAYSANPTVNNVDYPTITNTALASTTINLDGLSYADYNYSNNTTAAAYTTGWTSRPASGKVRYITLTLNPSKASGVITTTWTGVTWIGTAGSGTTTASKASTYACIVGNSTSYCSIVTEAY